MPLDPAAGSDTLARLYREAGDDRDYARGYLARLAELQAAVDPGAVAALGRRLEAVMAAGQRVYLAGNGGCAALAAHFVNDAAPLALAAGGPPLRAVSLSDNAATLTAIANDHGYDQVFAQQLRQHAVAGDLLIALSVSGDSASIVEAVKVAQALGCGAAGLCGFDGGYLRQHCDPVIYVRSTRDEYGPVQDVFSAVIHAVTGYLSMRWGLSLRHGG